MCGIYCTLGRNRETEEEINPQRLCKHLLHRRGPDQSSSITTELNGGWNIYIAATVLWMQGKMLCEQPIHGTGRVLCWNGDIFRGPLAEKVNSCGQSDTQVLFENFSTSSPLESLNKVDGPFSIVYLDETQNTLWLARDSVGRHSLLWGVDENTGDFIVTSVGHRSLTYLKEVPAVGLFEVCIPSAGGNLEIKLHPWAEMGGVFECGYHFPIPIKVARTYPTNSRCMPLNLPAEPSDKDLSHFEQFDVNTPVQHIMETLLGTGHICKNVDLLHSLLEDAVQVRVQKTVPLCQKCIVQENAPDKCEHSNIALLFSGGLDSAILAALANKFIPEDVSIDLMNVAFERSKKDAKGSVQMECGKNNENKRANSQNSKFGELSSGVMFDVPDRVTGRKSLQELKNLFPARKWNFVEIDINQEELQKERLSHISNLIHPLNTILDDSLGCALWFATRGKGAIHGGELEYTSPARVVLLGMGADEQFGGYMRHRNAFRNSGWKGLASELREDVQRISVRNLGRDNRVTSDFGRQPRMPYLDKTIIEFTQSLAPWEKCCPTKELPCGVGDKLLLRLLAWKLGLHGAAVLPKRAMQFGSRIANSREKADQVSQRL